MLSPSQIRLALLPLLMLAVPVLAVLAVIAFQQALAAGTAEVLMMAWVLAFVVGAPALLLLLPLVERVRSRQKAESRIIPPAGEQIP